MSSWMISFSLEWNFPLCLNLISIGSSSRRNFPFQRTPTFLTQDQPARGLRGDLCGDLCALIHIEAAVEEPAGCSL